MKQNLMLGAAALIALLLSFPAEWWIGGWVAFVLRYGGVVLAVLYLVRRCRIRRGGKQ